MVSSQIKGIYLIGTILWKFINDNYHFYQIMHNLHLVISFEEYG